MLAYATASLATPGSSPTCDFYFSRQFPPFAPLTGLSTRQKRKHHANAFPPA